METFFICPHCGNAHEGYPTDYGWTLPDEVWALSKRERKSKTSYNADLCRYGKRYFIRGVLSLPFKDQPGEFGWGIWVEVDGPIFQKYLDLYEKDALDEPRITGYLANQPPGYEDLLHHQIEIQFGISTQRPTLWFSQDSTQAMAMEQRFGIDHVRYHEILKAIGGS